MPSTVVPYPAALGTVFGMPTPETGVLVESYEENVECDVYEQKNGTNETVQVVTYNPRSTLTIGGETTAGFVGTVGQPFDAANLSNLGGVSTGLVLVKTIKLNKTRTANQKVTMTAVRFPLVISA